MMRTLARLLPATSAASASDWQSSEPWVRHGFNVCIFLIGGLFLWSAMVQISGAVVAPGAVAVESNTKTVQHLDGGIVERILVRNGDRVAAGDVLVTLDPTAVKASHTVARSRVGDLAVQLARLEAERDGKATLDLPAGLDAADPQIATVLNAQRQLFEARRTARSGEQSVLAERLAQLDGEIRGLSHQLTARTREREISARELATVMPLYEKGYVNQQRIGPLQREAARLDGEVGRLASEETRLAAARAEAELRLQQSRKAFLESVVDELRKVQGLLAEARESERSLADKLQRTDIRAPRAGIVHAIAIHTEGGVITPASPILQIVPEDEKLVVEAQLTTTDIDKVHPGQRAAVRFPAFNAHTTPRLEGNVTRVSPAQITDRDGRSYFTATVEIPAAEIAHIPAGSALRPGMGAEVHIETTRRSILSYFLKPLTDNFARTFRES